MTNHTPDTFTGVLVDQFLSTKDPMDCREFLQEYLAFMVDDCEPCIDEGMVAFATTMTGDELLARKIVAIANAWHIRGPGPVDESAIARTVATLLTQLD